MAFIETRLLIDVERGADGGPEFSVTIFELANGFEARNLNWSQDRRSFDVSYGITTFANLEAVVDAFHAVNGNRDGFRFKDWSAYDMGVLVGAKIMDCDEHKEPSFGQKLEVALAKRRSLV